MQTKLATTLAAAALAVAVLGATRSGTPRDA